MFKTMEALLGRRKKTTVRAFKDYYAEWIQTLKNTLLPHLRHSMSLTSSSSTLLASHVEMLHQHFQAYYESLCLAASSDVAQLLFPEWRNSLEIPFLWLGDLHPYLFVNLLRSFLGQDDDEKGFRRGVELGEISELFDKPWHVATAWENPPKTLTCRIDQIECGLRLIVPSLAARARSAQAGFIEKVGVAWGKSDGEKEEMKGAIGEASAAVMEEMTSIFMDANRLRRSVLAEIVSASSVYQSALFLESLAQFLIGFRDQEFLYEFNRCKMPINP